LHCIVIDETASSPQAFYAKHGWAPVGEECIQLQFVVGGRHLSVMAAVAPIGFLCWEIYEGGISHEQFVHFLETKVRDFVMPDS